MELLLLADVAVCCCLLTWQSALRTYPSKWKYPELTQKKLNYTSTNEFLFIQALFTDILI
jgi:hypothetical protein